MSPYLLYLVDVVIVTAFTVVIALTPWQSSSIPREKYFQIFCLFSFSGRCVNWMYRKRKSCLYTKLQKYFLPFLVLLFKLRCLGSISLLFASFLFPLLFFFWNLIALVGLLKDTLFLGSIAIASIPSEKLDTFLMYLGQYSILISASGHVYNFSCDENARNNNENDL